MNFFHRQPVLMPKDIIRQALARHKKPKKQPKIPFVRLDHHYVELSGPKKTNLFVASCSCGWKFSEPTVGRYWTENIWGDHLRQVQSAP